MFKPATFENKTKPSWSPLRYVVRGSSLRIMVNPRLAAKAGILDGQGVRLDIDVSRSLGRLLPQERERRSFRTRTKGTMIGYWPWNGELETRFPKAEGANLTMPLVVSETTKTEGLIFELPTI